MKLLIDEHEDDWGFEEWHEENIANVFKFSNAAAEREPKTMAPSRPGKDTNSKQKPGWFRVKKKIEAHKHRNALAKNKILHVTRFEECEDDGDKYLKLSLIYPQT